jgi:hypothetical protein
MNECASLKNDKLLSFFLTLRNMRKHEKNGVRGTVYKKYIKVVRRKRIKRKISPAAGSLF